MQLINNPFQAMLDTLTKPNRVFATIKQTHNWSWLPFFVISVSAALPVYLYFNHVDFEWYKTSILQSLGPMTPEQMQGVNIVMQKPQTIWSNTIGAVFSSIIANAILALYLNVVSKRDEECVQEYTDWYGFTWWISLPVVLFNLLAALIVLLSSDIQLPMANLSPSSLAFILNVEPTSPWFTFSLAMRLETLWIIYLAAVGLGQWTQFSTKSCFLFAGLPFVFIWLVWCSLLLLG